MCDWLSLLSHAWPVSWGRMGLLKRVVLGWPRINDLSKFLGVCNTMSQSVYSFLVCQLECMERSLENFKLLSIACAALGISCRLARWPSLWLCPSHLLLPSWASRDTRSPQMLQCLYAPGPVFTLLLLPGGGTSPDQSRPSPMVISWVSQAPLTLQSLSSLICFHRFLLQSKLLGAVILHAGISSASTVLHVGDASCVFVERANCLRKCPCNDDIHRFFLIQLHPEFSGSWNHRNKIIIWECRGHRKGETYSTDCRMHEKGHLCSTLYGVWILYF